MTRRERRANVRLIITLAFISTILVTASYHLALAFVSPTVQGMEAWFGGFAFATALGSAAAILFTVVTLCFSIYDA